MIYRYVLLRDMRPDTLFEDLVVCGAPSAVLLRLEYFAVKNLPACTYVLICTMTTGDMFHTQVWNNLSHSTVLYVVPHFCALSAPMFHTLVWNVPGRNRNLARAFPSCKKKLKTLPGGSLRCSTPFRAPGVEHRW
jgi:hypothetical protein